MPSSIPDPIKNENCNVICSLARRKQKTNIFSEEEKLEAPFPISTETRRLTFFLSLLRFQFLNENAIKVKFAKFIHETTMIKSKCRVFRLKYPVACREYCHWKIHSRHQTPNEERNCSNLFADFLFARIYLCLFSKA